MSAQPVLWTRQFPYGAGQVLVARLNPGWRLELQGREAAARSLVTAFEQALGDRCSKAEIEVVLAALTHNERQYTGAAA